MWGQVAAMAVLELVERDQPADDVNSDVVDGPVLLSKPCLAVFEVYFTIQPINTHRELGPCGRTADVFRLRQL